MSLLKQTLLLACGLLFFIQISTAQVLIPYLGKNGLYGLADESGKLLIPPQFTKLDHLISAQAPAFSAEKDGVRMRVLKNGMMFPDRGGASYYVVDYSKEPLQVQDTLPHLIALDFNGDMVYVNTKTGKKVAALRAAKDAPSWLIYDRHRLLGGQKFAKAVDGYIRVGRPFSRINFLDLELNLVFPNDFETGTVVDDQYFIVAKEALKCAIADRSGKLRTKFDWNFLEGTPKKGFFVAGFRGSNPDEAPASARFGLINADGKYLIKAVFTRIRAAGDQFLMVRNDAGEGIMDYSGKELSPIVEGFLAHAFGDLFVRDPNFARTYDPTKKATLINAKGKSQLSFEVDHLKFVGESETPQAHFQFSKGPISGVLSTDLKVLFQDTMQLEAITFNGKTCFLTTDKGRYSSTGLQGLRDFSGKEILPMAYENITNLYGTELLRVKKAGLFGLMTMDGKAVLPCRFEDIHLSISGDEKTFFGKENNRYLAFDENGKRLPDQDCLHPMQNKNDLVFQPNTRPGQQKKVVFGDGNIVDTPAEWGNYVNLKGMDSPVGILVIKENPGNYELYDTRLKALLPAGFRLPRNQFNPRRYEHVGLVPVWQVHPNARKIPPPQVVSDSNESPTKISLDGPELVDQVVEESGPDYIGCGVMDARGTWVIPPTPEARFEPLTWNLVAEYALAGPERVTKYPRKLHRVNHPNPAVFDISRTEGWDEGLAWSNCITWQYQDNPEDASKGKVQRCTWFSREGEQLAPFDFVMGPRHLKAYNVVSRMVNGQKVGLIVNEKAQKMADLSDLDEIPGHGYSNFTDGYVVAKKGGKWGVLDSTGQVAILFNFGDLTILEGGRFLQEASDKSPKTYRLLNWQGKFIAEADIPIDLRVLDSGECFAALNFRTIGESQQARSLMFSADGRQMAEIPGRYMNDVVLGSKKRFAKFWTVDKQLFWVDLETGKAFMEE